MEPDGDDHRVGPPSVKFAHDSKRHVLTKGEDVVIGVFDRRAIVEHQKNSADHQRQENKEGKPAGAPGEPKPRARFSHFDRVEVKENVGQYRQGAVPLRIAVAMTEHGFIELGFLDFFEVKH